MRHPNITRIAQAIAALILLLAAGMKFMGDPDSVKVFETLGMEPTGRYLIASIELLAALLLVSPFAAMGSVIAVAVMCGAVIAHVSQLGLSVHGDSGMMVGQLVMVLTCSTYVLLSRRKELPFIGDTL